MKGILLRSFITSLVWFASFQARRFVERKVWMEELWKECITPKPSVPHQTKPTKQTYITWIGWQETSKFEEVFP